MAEERIDPDEPAHLRDASGAAPPIDRYLPAADLTDLVRRYWVPVWSLPQGERTVQRVLQYPVCLLVIETETAMLVGPSSGLAVRELHGSGWAFGVLLQPAAGALLLGGPVAELVDSATPLASLPTMDGATLARDIRAVLAAEPADEERQRAAAELVENQLRALLPVDGEGLLINRIVEYTEGSGQVRRVAQVCAEFGIGERTLQRLSARRIGLGPKWLIQRRRLHEAAAMLRQRRTGFDLAAVAADLGYADQAHFIRDFHAVTGLTPGQYAAEPR
ncbi:helix-turn-helix domain-containing protein [Nocardioides sp. Bht2]|uniref:AraC family transcriptional regulator n=1 Tax=Nocardioides sp. Bht2 TaxID=3392297 RepID=UPI0039B6C60B